MGVFFIFSDLDIYFSGLFFKNGEFYLKNNFLVDLIYDYAQIFALVLGFLLIFLAFIFALLDRRFSLRLKKTLFLISSALLGPILIVNLFLKEFIPRARPREIVEFGGDFFYTKIFSFAHNNCLSNCSFVCGHCSAGFIMIAFAYLFSGYKKRLVFLLGFLYGLGVSAARLVVGGHFLSDAIFAFLFVFLAIRFSKFLILDVRS